ncbi:MAG: hypothetical protein AAF721_29000 [Myxococcota bacterium]
MQTAGVVAIFALAAGCRDDSTSAGASGDSTGDAEDGDGGPGDDDADGDGTGTSGGEDADSSGDDGTEDGTDDGPPPPPTSPTANVRFKGPKQLRNDFARALSLPPDELCFELGDLSCTDDVHAVTLGGVEPDALGIYEPAKTSTATTPIAVDRIALAACGRRVDADFAGAPVIFDVPLSGAALADVDGAEVTSAVTDLYRRILLRDPTAAELDLVRGLYTDVAATASDQPARDWAVASCFAVLTTMESLFY